MKCAQCGYSLVGLDAGGVCPECGLAIAASLGPRIRAPESKVSRYVHTAILTFLCGTGVAYLLDPSLRWYYGPTEYDGAVSLLGLLAAFVGTVTSLINIVARAWGARLVVLVMLTVLLWIPVLQDRGRTY
jgi:hypothetical protein